MAGACAHAPPIVHYGCNSGQRIDVRYPNPKTAILEIFPRAYAMKAAPSLVGRRYKNNHLQWRIENRGNGPEGTLFTPGPAGGPGAVAERCHEIGRSQP